MAGSRGSGVTRFEVIGRGVQAHNLDLDALEPGDGKIYVGQRGPGSR